MIITLIILGIIVFYVLPMILVYRHTRLAHSKGGRWEYQSPSFADIFFMAVLIANIVVCIIAWVGFPPYKNPKTVKIDYNRIFNVRKERKR